MKTSALPLPEYEKPPVVEVAISLQFAPLERMRTSHAGILWGGLRREFPRIEEYPPLDPVFESFATPAPQTTLRSESFGAQAPPLRVWFMNDAKDQLIQLQRDRLVVNWRQGAGSYPRFHQIIRHFHTALSEFRRLVKTEALGEITPNQCEITYVNHMPAGLGWQQPGELGEIVTVWQERYSDLYLSSPEDAGLFARYRITSDDGKPLGRLHVVLQPIYRPEDKRPILALTLTARGQPRPRNSGDDDGVTYLFDLQHEWIVRGFTSLTTESMHKLWGRIQ